MPPYNKNDKKVPATSVISNGMQVVDVIPLSRGMQKETLSYFTAKPVSVGDMVLIPLRNKEVPALVVHVADATAEKTHIKKSAYGLRKIIRVHAHHFFLPAFISAAEKTAMYFACSTGAVIESLTPSAVSKTTAAKKRVISRATREEKNEKPKSFFEVLAFQAPFKDRLTSYKGVIREEFAKRRSVLFLTPTADDIPYILSFLEKGIEGRAHVVHGGLSKQKLLGAWRGAASAGEPVLIVGTMLAASIPRSDLGTIIIDKEDSWLYKQERRPFLDARVFAEHFAQTLNGRCIRGGTVLSVETLHRREQKEIADFVPAQFRILSSAEQSLVDMRGTHSPLQLTPKTFTVISDELQRAIEDVRAQNQHAFLFGARRGLFPVTVCSDCGASVLCTECEAPLTLHTKAKNERAGERIYLCHKCKKENVVSDRCTQCNSWRLAPLGVGIERIEEEARRLFGTIKITRIDKDKTPTDKKVEKAMSDFLASPGSILVGTELALRALKKKIALTAAVSIDPLFALPSFRMNERVFHLLLSLREKANKKCIIQTRMPELSIFTHVRNGNITDFYKEEKISREKLGYPPFTVIIKLTAMGTKQHIEKEISLIKKQLRDYSPFVFPAFISKIRGKYVVHAMIKIKKENWPNETLRAMLSELPPSVAVNVEPEHLL